MRLNKEPPDDVSVVEFVGVSSPTSITPMPVRPKGPGSSSVKSREGVGKAGYGAGAGRASLTAASSTIALEDGESDDDDQGADLEKIKGSTLGEDDHCVVCLSGEERNEQRRVYEVLYFLFFFSSSLLFFCLSFLFSFLFFSLISFSLLFFSFLSFSADNSFFSHFFFCFFSCIPCMLTPPPPPLKSFLKPVHTRYIDIHFSGLFYALCAPLPGPRTSTIVHGEIGHIACCLECARILKVCVGVGVVHLESPLSPRLPPPQIPKTHHSR